MRTFALTLGIFALGATAFAASSPREVCQQLAAAAKANDYATFSKLASPAGRSIASVRKGNSKTLQKAHKGQLEKLKNLSCETELIAGSQAVVKATSKGESRLVPFLRAANQWRFDLKTYRAFNQIAAK